MKKIFLIILILIIGVSITTAQPVIFQAQVDKKIAQDGAANYYFGSAVAIDSTTIMIGSTGHDNFRGAVYVFTKTDSGWFQTQFLEDPNSVPGEFFGNAIDIKENTAAIAGYGRRVVLIYQNVGGSWTYRSTIYLEEQHYWFGESVQVNHYNSILIGCPAGFLGATGRAYLYSFNSGWGIVKIFYPNDSSKTFGNAVSFIPDTVAGYLIGDEFHSTVYLEVRNGGAWTEYLFTNPTPGNNFGFGWAIESPNSSTIIISSYNYGFDPLACQGAVYVYKYNPSIGWQQTQRILSPEPKPNALFGYSISAYGDKLLIGACYENNYMGAAYLYSFQDGNYVFKKKIVAEDGEENDQFGVSVGLFENNYVIGAHQDNVNNFTNCGSAYIYSPAKLGKGHNLTFFASTIHSGTISIDTSSINYPGQLPHNMILHSKKAWNINAQNGFDFQDGMIGADLNNLGKKSNLENHLCWLKRTNENSPWEYIGGKVSDNYLYSTIPFNTLSQFVIVDSVDTATYAENEDLIVKKFELYQNYPNPFNPSTKISWHSPVGSWQTIKVFDVLGNEVATLIDEYKSAGSYEVEFNGQNLSSGVYFYQLRAGEFISTKKMLYLK
ncbi:MAG: hypothetical protein KatS3mg036_0349 [Ignavibacterium sp.]|uniref:T9SS type A sorting domain-containing protein n=1 Tax=Ignavibacterium sp. TaxID=2651167 RepID=UPI0021DEF5E0|nr:T9SS type A sorting domain-containing protein [Ignavibacterium sp.]BDQ03648.1 MAG: hypothetical protein KatS3mg037_2223 [Ignavibacterium sp.]GIV45531.1 MAG: hypothetical protein KatS3mg036_0349 [Ignavibacterium sp.]